MSVLDNLLECINYKAVFLYDTRSAYIWRDGVCTYHQNLSVEQVSRLKELTKRAVKKFSVKDVAFGFSS